MDSEMIAELVEEGKTLVVGAIYNMESGEVAFFDGSPFEMVYRSL